VDSSLCDPFLFSLLHMVGSCDICCLRAVTSRLVTTASACSMSPEMDDARLPPCQLCWSAIYSPQSPTITLISKLTAIVNFIIRSSIGIHNSVLVVTIMRRSSRRTKGGPDANIAFSNLGAYQTLQAVKTHPLVLRALSLTLDPTSPAIALRVR
jgi:hypothetical protein